MKKYTGSRRGIPLSFIALAIGVLVVAFAIAQGSSAPTQTAAASAPTTQHTIEASYVTLYNSMASMKVDSAFILTGTVTGVKQVGELSGAHRIETDYTVRVQRVVYDRHSFGLHGGQTITVRALGGTLPDGTVWQDGDSLPMQAGQHYLLYLRDWMHPTTTMEPYYWAINGGTGRFPIDASGKVQHNQDKHSLVTLPAAVSIDAVDAQMKAAPSK